MNTYKAAALTGAGPERRPMFAREWNVAQSLADCLVRAGVSPNVISLAGMGASAGAGVALAMTVHAEFLRAGFLIAAVAIVLRGMANVLDGMVAVQRGTASPLGELYNEVPDRVSDVAILVGAGYAFGSSPVLGFAAALSALLTAYVRAQGKAIGTPHQYCGPMAKPQRMFTVGAAAVLCGVLPLEWQPSVPVLNAHLGLVGIGLTLIAIGGVWTSWRRLVRIAREARRSYTACV